MSKNIYVSIARLHLSDGDYILTEGGGWFALKGFAVRIQETDDGIVVDVYPDQNEMSNPLASTRAYTADLEEK